MIPRLHPRGSSFRGACDYILHDADKAKTLGRVPWAMTANLATQDPKWAWHEMVETYWAQGALKAASGVDQRGRKNTKPVLHYSLSWDVSENPSPEEMQKAALSSLKAMGLEEHQALITSHTDTKHPHVHIVVNTVHPITGKTADLKFTKLELSRWAEAYERENGIHCEERIRNNAEREREQIRKSEARALDPTALLMGQKRLNPTKLLEAASEQKQRGRVPRVKDRKSENRRRWLDKKDVVDRMKRMRAEAEVYHKIDRNKTWERHRAERDALWQNSRAAVRQATAHVWIEFKPHWVELYKLQRQEIKFIDRSTPLERAIFVMKNRERLGNWKPLKKREMHAAIKYPDRLYNLLIATHARERAGLSQIEKAATHRYTGKILDDYARRHNALLSRQTDERQAQRLEQFKETRKVTFADARDSLLKDLKDSPPERDFKRPEAPHVGEAFEKAAEDSSVFPDNSEELKRQEEQLRAEEIRREMAEWRKKNRGRDFGREL